MGSELRLYDVAVGAHQTRMRLDDNDAARLGDAAVLVTEPTTPPSPPVDVKARPTTPNKSRVTGELSAHSEREAN